MSSATPAPDSFPWVPPLTQFPPAESSDYDAGNTYSVSAVSALFGGLISLCIVMVCIAGVIAERKAEKAERQIAAAADLEDDDEEKGK